MGVVDLHGIAGKSAAPVDNTIEFEREIHRSALNCDPCKTCKPHDRGLDSGYGLHVGLYVTVEDHGVKVHHHLSSAEAKEQDQHSQTQHLSTAGLPVAGHTAIYGKLYKHISMFDSPAPPARTLRAMRIPVLSAPLKSPAVLGPSWQRFHS